MKTMTKVVKNAAGFESNSDEGCGEKVKDGRDLKDSPVPLISMKELQKHTALESLCEEVRSCCHEDNDKGREEGSTTCNTSYEEEGDEGQEVGSCRHEDNDKGHEEGSSTCNTSHEEEGDEGHEEVRICLSIAGRPIDQRAAVTH